MKVLLGIGGTDDSLDALERMTDRIGVTGDELTIAVVDNSNSPMSPEDVKQAARETVRDASIDAEVRRVTGDGGSRLVEIAETEGFDQIALGGGQLSPMGKINLGRISEFVLLNAMVSVRLVR
jgi:Universal stress protein family.